MTDRDALHEALTHLETRRGRLDPYRKAWTGEAPAAYLSTESRDALDKRLTRLGVNYPRLVVSSLVDRMRVSGFRREGSQGDGADVSQDHRTRLRGRGPAPLPLGHDDPPLGP